MRISYYDQSAKNHTNKKQFIRVLIKWCKGLAIGFTVYAILYLFAIACGY